MIRAAILLAFAALTSAPALGQSPEMLERTPPRYPVLGQMTNTTAVCRVGFSVTPAGATASVCAVCAIRHFGLTEAQAELLVEQFNTAAEEAAAGWRYTVTPNGHPQVRTDMYFLFDGDGEDAAPEPPEFTPCLNRPIARALTPERGLA